MGYYRDRVKAFKGKVHISDVQNEFDALVNAINANIDKINSYSNLDVSDFYLGSIQIPSANYTLTLGALKSILAAYDNTALGGTVVKMPTNENRSIVFPSLVFKNGIGVKQTPLGIIDKPSQADIEINPEVGKVIGYDTNSDTITEQNNVITEVCTIYNQTGTTSQDYNYTCSNVNMMNDNLGNWFESGGTSFKINENSLTLDNCTADFSNDKSWNLYQSMYGTGHNRVEIYYSESVDLFNQNTHESQLIPIEWSFALNGVIRDNITGRIYSLPNNIFISLPNPFIWNYSEKVYLNFDGIQYTISSNVTNNYIEFASVLETNKVFYRIVLQNDNNLQFLVKEFKVRYNLSETPLQDYELTNSPYIEFANSNGEIIIYNEVINTKTTILPSGQTNPDIITIADIDWNRDEYIMNTTKDNIFVNPDKSPAIMVNTQAWANGNWTYAIGLDNNRSQFLLPQVASLNDNQSSVVQIDGKTIQNASAGTQSKRHCQTYIYAPVWIPKGLASTVNAYGVSKALYYTMN